MERFHCDAANIANESGFGLAGDNLLQCRDRARFANPRLADHGDDLTVSRARQTPAVEQQPQLVRTAEEWQSVAGADRSKAALDRCLAVDPPGRQRARETFQLVLAEGFELEKSAE